MNFAGSLWDIALGGVTFLLVITVLVAVHELGHFLFARMFGMEVKAFAIMMGGVRRTSLRPYLEQPLLPAAVPAALGAASGAILLAGLIYSLPAAEWAGLFLLSLALPVWTAWRLERLYHLEAWSALRTLGISYAGGLLLMMMGARGSGINASLVGGVLMASGLVGVLITYYKPLAGKPEDSEMGEGQIMIGSSGKRIPVRFRPLLWFTDRRGTEFSLLLLPLGGFAAIKGMHPREDGSEVSIEGGFYSRPPWQRFLALFAGPLFSVLFGVLILTGLFATVGMEKDIPSTRIGLVQPGSPAAKAGIRPGDEIVSVNGRKVTQFFELVAAVRGQNKGQGEAMTGQPTTFGIRRDGAAASVTVVPRISRLPKPVLTDKGVPTGREARQSEIGIQPQPNYERLSLDRAALAAMATPGRMVSALAATLSTPKEAGNALGGPITIAKVSTTAAKLGLYSVLMMAALLSITLGIMNLLPIPPLDGGQMVVALVEMVRRKRMGLGLQQGLSMVGLLFVIGLTLLTFAVDIGRQAEQNRQDAKTGRR